MTIDDALISRLEQLTRLELTPAEREQSKKDLAQVLDMVEKLHELDLDGVEPLVYINEQTNVLRADQIDNQVSREDALRNAPDHDGEHFRVPKVIPQ